MVSEILDLALLGMGAGAIYGLLAQGLVVVYRGSGVLNFAQGAFAMPGAYLFYQFNQVLGWSSALSFVAAVVILAAAGAFVQLAIMRPMRRSAALARVIATLGILIVLESLAQIKFGTAILLIPSFLPNSTLTITKGLYI